MRARILTIPGSGDGRAALSLAEQILTAAALSFSHELTLKAEPRADIGEALARYGTALAGDGEALKCVKPAAVIRDFRADKALAPLCRLRCEAFSVLIASAYTKGGEELITAFAKEEELEIERAASFAEGFLSLTREPSRERIILLEGESPLCDCATALCGVPSSAADVYLHDGWRIYAPAGGMDDARSPLGAIKAAELLLSHSLRLEKEAACVAAATRNVLDAGWRTADISAPGCPRIGAEAMTSLITEQVETAGELLGKHM